MSKKYVEKAEACLGKWVDDFDFQFFVMYKLGVDYSHMRMKLILDTIGQTFCWVDHRRADLAVSPGSCADLLSVCDDALKGKNSKKTLRPTQPVSHMSLTKSIGGYDL